MSTASAMFVESTVDEFTKIERHEHRNFLIAHLDKSDPANNAAILKLASQTIKGNEAIFLRCDFVHREWFHARSGKLSILCDGDVTDVPYKETEAKPEDYGQIVQCKEYGYYLLSREILKRICDAKTVKIRFYGANVYKDLAPDYCVTLQIMMRQFYNNVWDKTLYIDSLKEIDGDNFVGKIANKIFAKIGKRGALGSFIFVSFFAQGIDWINEGKSDRFLPLFILGLVLGAPLLAWGIQSRKKRA